MTPVRATYRRVAHAAVAFALMAVGSLALAASAAAAAQPSLTVTGGGRHFTLRPGEPVYWTIGVTTRAVQLSSLVIRATANGRLADASAPRVTLSLAGCTTAWHGETCGTVAAPLLPATPLGDIDGTAHPLVADGTIPAEASLLAIVELDPAHSAPRDGPSAVITIEVHAAGIGPSAGAQPPPGRGGGPLAHTGTGIVFSVVLGVVAAAVGIVLSGLARRSHPTSTR